MRDSLELSDSGAGAATRERILRAAERLFAERGIDAVSIRDITSEAGANKAAIHYHFGSKAELVRAILEWRATRLGALRGAWLDRIESSPDPTLREVLEALVVPVAEMASDAEGGRHHIGFLAAVLANPELMPSVIDAFGPYTERLMAALTRVTPQLSQPVRELRFALAKDLVNRAIGQPDGAIHTWVELRSPGADDQLAQRLVEFLVGAFSAAENS